MEYYNGIQTFYASSGKVLRTWLGLAYIKVKVKVED